MHEKKYRSAFTNWRRQASIYSRPMETFPTDECGGSCLFSPQLVPWSQHPIVISKGPHAVRQILAGHLLAHLQFTDTLENELITPVCYMLGRRPGDFDLPGAMAEDARKIAVDEVYHALMVADLANQLVAALLLEGRAVRRHPFLNRVEECLTELPAETHGLLRFMAACVSETLITGTLAGVPNDDKVASVVRNTLRNHAEDEARHNAYFSKAIEVVWPQLQLR